MVKKLDHFNQFKNYKELPKKPGIYEVRAKKEFIRLSGKKTNIVYIGKAEGKQGLYGRTRSFFTKSGSGRKDIGRFKTLKGKMHTEFLYFYRLCEGQNKARDEEKKEIEKYTDKFWELPPLNHNK